MPVLRAPDGPEARRAHDPSRSTTADRMIEEQDMHQVTYDMVKYKIEEELQYAARQRRAREAVRDRPRAIDFSGLRDRIRVRLLGAGGGRPAAPAGA
jgi:hypothetical protein